MAKKTDRGTKRVCGSCDAKFYDLNKDPITCPLCGTVFVPEVVAKAPVPEPKAEKVVEEKTEEATDDKDTVSLDEVAAAEESDDAMVDGDDDDDALVDLDTDDDIPAGDDDDTFLAEEDEGDDDVSDVIGGPIKDDDDT